MIELVDFKGGNLGSITNCLKRLGISFRMVSAEHPPSGSVPIIFPGVGAFGAAMTQLHTSGLTPLITEAVQGGTPYLGICIGLQVLLTGSEEAPGVSGLNLIPGKVVRFTQGKIPQIGWNWIESENESQHPGGYVYFVNSYYPNLDDKTAILYQASYHGQFVAGIQKNNITAFQFHPEKSSTFGQSLIERWYRSVA
jgi:imidazole glycerol phosphate synthase glutamine amidotransferase subunit